MASKLSTKAPKWREVNIRMRYLIDHREDSSKMKLCTFPIHQGFYLDVFASKVEQVFVKVQHLGGRERHSLQEMNYVNKMKEEVRNSKMKVIDQIINSVEKPAEHIENTVSDSKADSEYFKFKYRDIKGFADVIKEGFGEMVKAFNQMTIKQQFLHDKQFECLEEIADSTSNLKNIKEKVSDITEILKKIKNQL